jgi:MFS family permease
MTSERKSTATRALTLLLAINLFNYIDRYVLASVLPTLKHEFLAGDPNQNGKAGLWTTAFLISYMFTAPIFGWLADRFSRWILIGTSVALWSLASGWVGSGYLVWGSALHKIVRWDRRSGLRTGCAHDHCRPLSA